MYEKIFRNTKFSILWLIIRVWVGYQWLSSGLGKLSEPVWIGPQAGVAIKGFWTKAAGLAVGPDGQALPAAAKYVWYQNFLKGLIDSGSEVWFSYFVVYAEILVGIGLILGSFTIMAAIGGALLNLNFMLAGTASSNPVLYTLSILLILAGINAGYYGVDRFLMPLIKNRVKVKSKVATA